MVNEAHTCKLKTLFDHYEEALHQFVKEQF